MDNSQYLKDLAEAEKRAKQTELDQARAQAIKSVQQEQDKTMPTFEKQKQQANVQSQIGAKNFAEYWANRGQSYAGINAQEQISRANVLGRDIGNINTQETDALKDFNNQRTGYETQYQNNLTNAYNTIDNTLQTNLYNEKVRQEQARAEQQRYQEELAYKKQQDAIANAQAWARIQQEQENQTPKISTPYYQGKLNADALMGTFSNGYQPNNIGGQPLKKSGDTIKFNTQTLDGTKQTVKQTIWQTPDGKKWYWEGRANKYIQFNG